MLKYWDDSSCTKGKRNKVVKYCCFIWTQELILKTLVFILVKIWVWGWQNGSSSKSTCLASVRPFVQIPMPQKKKKVNDKSKSSVTQEEMEYALCWRQSPVVLFPPREKKKNSTHF
jgi:hypothetical protein